MLTRTRTFEHITPVLQRLHWLPINFRIQFKVILLTSKAFHDKAHIYINELVQFHNPSRHLSLLSVPRTFHHMATVPSTHVLLNFGTHFLQIYISAIHLMFSKRLKKPICSKLRMIIEIIEHVELYLCTVFVMYFYVCASE